MLGRKHTLRIEGFDGSGADWLARYKRYINDGVTVVTSPHKVFGPERHDLALQLRKRGIDKVIMPVCPPICVPSPICGNWWSRALKSWWSLM